MADEPAPAKRGRPSKTDARRYATRLAAARIVYPLRYAKPDCLSEIDRLAKYLETGNLPD